MTPRASNPNFLRPRTTSTALALTRYLAAVLLAMGALAVGIAPGGLQRPIALICTFAVLISPLIGGYAAGWITLAISGAGLWFLIPNGRETASMGFQSGPGLVLKFTYLALGIVLVEVIRRLQRERTKLQERDQRLRLAGRAARIWFWEWDLLNNVLSWSRDGEANVDEEEHRQSALELYVKRRVHPEDRERLLNALFQAATQQQRLELEYRVLSQDGSVHWISTKGKIFDSNGSSVMLGIASEITAQKEADEVRSHFRAVLGSLIEGVCYVDTAGAIQYMNAAAERMLGYRSEQVRGKQLHDLIHIGCDAARHDSCCLFRALEARHPCHIQEQTLNTKDGEKLVIEYTAAPVTSDGITLGAVMMFRDISERKRAEQAVKASEKMAATGRIAATISHELRNPLDSVMQLLYLVKQSGKLGEVEKQQLDLVDQELRRMTEVAQQTLAMHRQSSQMVPVNLAKLIDGVMLLYGKKIRSQKIQIDRRYDWQGEVPGFPAELRQVFTNLIVNGVDAMPSGGKLCVHVRAHREPSGKQRRGVLVALFDSGTGIPSHVRKHLFQPFFTTKGEKGSGVGLWVSSGIVQRHNGTIRVRSNSRSGRSYTCFEVFLPENQPPIGVQETASKPQKAAPPARPNQSSAA